MKVYWPGNHWRTFHPELGELRNGEPFDLDRETARKYVRSGLLKEWKPKPARHKPEKPVPRGSSPDHSKHEA